MKISYVIKNAILSEKAYQLMDKSVYEFIVDRGATKAEISKAVEKQFSVKVKKVNVQLRPSKKRRVTGTRKQTEVFGRKKAIVFLEKGQSIAMLSPKTEKAPKSKAEKKNSDLKESKGKSKGLLSRIKKQREETKSE
jgi:ribosomal protein L23